jgi:hypothetical protein
MLLLLFPLFLAFIVGFALTNAWKNAFLACVVASFVNLLYFGIFLLFTGGGFGGMGIYAPLIMFVPGILASLFGALLASVTRERSIDGESEKQTTDANQ